VPAPGACRGRGLGIRVCAAGFVLAYLAAGGVTLALGDWVAGGGWLPLRLVLLGRPLTPPWRGASIPRRRCCIPPPVGERAATTRALAFNLRILAVLGGSAPAVPPGRAGAWPGRGLARPGPA
jgi:hypothetical protein